MKIALLDRPTVITEAGGRPVTLTGQDERFLTGLCLADGLRASKEEMSRWVWDEPPEDFRGLIDRPASNVRQLARRKSATDNLIQIHNGYYELAIEPLDIDVCRYRDSITTARAGAGAGNPASLDTFRRAFELWPDPSALYGGTPLVGVAGRTAAEYRARLRQEHRDALIEYLNAWLEMAPGDGLVTTLTDLAHGEAGGQDLDVAELLIRSHLQRNDARRALSTFDLMTRRFDDPRQVARLARLVEGIRLPPPSGASGPSQTSTASQQEPRFSSLLTGSHARSYVVQGNYHEENHLPGSTDLPGADS